MSARRVLTGAALAATVAAGVLIPTTASAAPTGVTGACGTTNAAYTSGAEAHWTIQCSGGNVSVTGWVKDTDADGQCAQVYAYFPYTGNWKYSARACPKGDVKEFTLTDQGSTGANVYLREIG
ncbi:hypothetical protein GCM10010302_42490 [Streptomyces polychromogenes]|uniref:Uncharacterized protein n=1 Tax=Streptomyces polychromogenes TaxID=67342 RepID=A0ABN0VGY6_9ACTN